MYGMHIAHTRVCPYAYMCPHIRVYMPTHMCTEEQAHTHRCAHTHTHTDLTDAPPPSSRPPLTQCGITLFRLYRDPLSRHTPKPEERSS